MANICYNTIAIKGEKKELVKMFNHAKVEIEDITDTSLKKINQTQITMRTWVPMPQTYIDYDTTNELPDKPEDLFAFPSERIQSFVHKRGKLVCNLTQAEKDELYKEYAAEREKAIEFQKNFYGIVGWYDYNVATLGTKWDAEVFDWEIRTENDNECIITAHCETAWNAPCEWLCKMQENYPELRFFMYSVEEAHWFVSSFDALSKETMDEIPQDVLEQFQQDPESEFCNSTMEDFVNQFWDDVCNS